MEPSQLQTALEALNGLGSSMLDYAIFAATVGTVVMALLELLKAVVYARRRFHEYEMRRWVERDAARRRTLDIFLLDGSKGSKRWAEFLELLTGGYATKRAAFDQPIEKLMAQIQAATNMALDYPDRYPEMYAFLTGLPSPQSAPSPEPGTSDAELWLRAARQRRDGANVTSADGTPTRDMRIGAEARARLQNLVARQLDALQTEVHYRWSRGNQFVATAAGATLTFMVLVTAQKTGTGPHVAVTLAMSLVAGLTSPFAKDVVSGLSGFARHAKS